MPAATAILIQIGNSDDKLSQTQWSSFCHSLLDLCESYGDVHFSGGSDPTAPWQNYAVMVESHRPGTLKMEIGLLRYRWGQDSIAWLDGQTQFI